MSRKKNKKTKAYYTLILLPSLPTKKKRQMKFPIKFATCLFMLICIFIAAGIVAGIYGYDAYMQARNEVITLRDANSELEKGKIELENKVTILSDTINEKVAQEEQAVQERIDNSIPTGFPLNGAAAIQDEQVDSATIFHVNSGVSVIAAGSGTVLFVGDDDEYGSTVQIAHEEGYISIYRCNEQAQVIVGQVLDRGTIIFTISDEDEFAYQIKKGEEFVNPMDLMQISG